MFSQQVDEWEYGLDPFIHVCLSLPTISGLRSENKVKLIYTLVYCKNSSERSYFARVVMSYNIILVKLDLDVF